MSSTANFSSRMAFILVTAGSAIGLGNVWSFPFVAGQSGGGGFILIYLVTLLFIAMPIFMAELVLGRLGKASPPKALAKLGEAAEGPIARHLPWALPAIIGVLTLVVIVSYYAVIAGQATAYLMEGLAGSFNGANVHAIQAIDQDFKARPLLPFLWAVIFLGITGLILAADIRKGLELAGKYLTPSLFVILLFLVGYSLLNGDAETAFNFLFGFSEARITPQIILQAVGQAFFTLGIGVGGIMMYGAYAGENIHIPRAVLWIVAMDLMVALLAGLAIFPLVFAEPNVEPGAGPSLIFITLPIVFAKIPFGDVIAALFFLLLTFAAITSAISMLAPSVQWLSEYGFTRRQASILASVVAMMLSLLTAFSFNIWADFYPLAVLGFDGMTVFDLLRESTNTIILPLGGVAFALQAGFGVKRAKLEKALAPMPALVFTFWYGLLRYLVPVAITAMFLNSLL